MSKIHKRILIIATLLLILSFLFPPFTGYFVSRGDNYKIFIGYCFIFKSPAMEKALLSYSSLRPDARKSVLNQLYVDKESQLYQLLKIYSEENFKFSANIEYNRLLLQILLIILLSIYCVFITSIDIKFYIHIIHHNKHYNN